MKKLLLFILLIFPFLLFAQDEIRMEDHNYNHSFGFGINRIPFSIPVFTDENEFATIPFNQVPWNLTYKIRLSEDHTLRSGVSFLIFPEDVHKYWVNSVNAGYEYEFNSHIEKLQWFLGGDLIVNYNAFILPQLNNGDFIERHLEMGLGPVGGVRFHINPRFSFSTEAGVFFAYRDIKVTNNLDVPEVVFTNGEWVFGAHRFLSLNFNYHFWFFRNFRSEVYEVE